MTHCVLSAKAVILDDNQARLPCSQSEKIRKLVWQQWCTAFGMEVAVGQAMLSNGASAVTGTDITGHTSLHRACRSSRSKARITWHALKLTLIGESEDVKRFSRKSVIIFLVV